MGYKSVCPDCKKVVNQGSDYTKFKNINCPECGNEMLFVNQRFRPPKSDAENEWKVVKLLLDNGFRYNPIYATEDGSKIQLKYPTILREAKDFVKKYKMP